jgi:hypothetical protein
MLIPRTLLERSVLHPLPPPPFSPHTQPTVQLKHSLFEFAVMQRCTDGKILRAVAGLLLQEPSVLLVCSRALRPNLMHRPLPAPMPPGAMHAFLIGVLLPS